MSRLMLRLNRDADHDDEMVRDFCCRLDLPYSDIRAIVAVIRPTLLHRSSR